MGHHPLAFVCMEDLPGGYVQFLESVKVRFPVGADPPPEDEFGHVGSGGGLELEVCSSGIEFLEGF